MNREIEMQFTPNEKRLYCMRYASLSEKPEHSGKISTTDFKLSCERKWQNRNIVLVGKPQEQYPSQ